jgi:polar amino acid transport system substrate-binding protein
VETCATSLHYETRFWPLPLDQLFSSLRSGVLDAHVLSHDPSRDGFLLYGKVPLFTDGYRPVVRAGSGIAIASLDDFDRLRLGHLSGLRYSAANYHDYVRRRIDAGTVVQAESNEQLLRLLVDGKVDAFVGLASTTRWLAHSLGLSDRIAVLPFAIKTGDYFLAVSRKSTHVKDKQAFLDTFDRCVLDLRKDGRYARLAAKYGM